MTDRVKFADSVNRLPTCFLTKKYIYAKDQASTLIVEDNHQLSEKSSILMATRNWPACTDFRRLTRRVEDVHHIRRGKSYRTLKRRRRRAPPPSFMGAAGGVLNFSY